MKKTLAAVAVLGAFAGTALAADVTLYGKVDLGLQYQNVKNVGHQDGVDKDTWGLKSGSNSGSRFGLKGSEQIADGLTVGFQLENGFTADDGKLGQGNRLFGREARLYVQTDFGEIGMGRMGALDSGLGSYDSFADAAAFGTGWGSTIGNMTMVFRGMSDRYDNTITYKSPEFSGVTVLAQVSLNPDNNLNYGEGLKGEGSSDVNRYYALGATGEWGALSAGLVYSTTDYNRVFANESKEDSSDVVSGYVAYDFGVVKATLGAQYYDNMVKANSADSIVKVNQGADGVLTEGYGVMLGAVAPVGAGTLYASLGYGDWEECTNSDNSYDIYQVGIGYKYPLSKRTYVYTAAGYTVEGSDAKNAEDIKTTEVVAGIVHNF